MNRLVDPAFYRRLLFRAAFASLVLSTGICLSFIAPAAVHAQPVAVNGLLPVQVQPQPYDEDEESLLRLLSAVVSVQAVIPENARTVNTLGRVRSGSGVVIDGTGLVVTIGYLILEAEKAWVQTAGGQRTGAKILAYDHDSGFGLLRANKPLDKVVPMPLGDSDRLEKGGVAVVVSFGRLEPAILPVQTISRRDFAGYWEYLLEDALFTWPPHRDYGGAALISTDGELVGIGSLVLSDADPEAAEPKHRIGNMFVPLNHLKEIIADLIAQGRSSQPPKPWLGLHTRQGEDDRVIVIRVARDGPAAKAGIEPGDLIAEVEGKRVRGLIDFYRILWKGRVAGDRITLDIRRDGRMLAVEIDSIDRHRWLRLSSP
ncbi:S1C family serine protease [Thioalkalivibrio sp. HK1]|uniref:S1C family serine protease n=1 Tax=Thioalkalivibrio sp. HK1 TaxID=1469245 RepID=UPI0004B09EE4|nr:S1C family serine protease [Thioalkalivibrio sp. HK1]